MIDKELNEREISPLLELLSIAKQRGMDQRELAARAGLSAVGVSKAKSRGDLRVSSLEALANALGLTIGFRPLQPRESAIDAIRQGQFFALQDEDDSP